MESLYALVLHDLFIILFNGKNLGVQIIVALTVGYTFSEPIWLLLEWRAKFNHLVITFGKVQHQSFFKEALKIL